MRPYTAKPATLAALFVFACFALVVRAQAPDVTGEWEAQYVTPLGPQQLTIYLQQEGPRVTGHTSSEFGEFQVRGSISGGEVKISWSEVDGSKTIVVAVTGKVDGDTITGTAKVGDRGEGQFRAQRTQ